MLLPLCCVRAELCSRQDKERRRFVSCGVGSGRMSLVCVLWKQDERIVDCGARRDVLCLAPLAAARKNRACCVV